MLTVSVGSLAAAQIKLHSGITIARLPPTAHHPWIPESTIKSGQTIFILKPHYTGSELTELTALKTA